MVEEDDDRGFPTLYRNQIEAHVTRLRNVVAGLAKYSHDERATRAIAQIDNAIFVLETGEAPAPRQASLVSSEVNPVGIDVAALTSVPVIGTGPELSTSEKAAVEAAIEAAEVEAEKIDAGEDEDDEDDLDFDNDDQSGVIA